MFKVQSLGPVSNGVRWGQVHELFPSSSAEHERNLLVGIYFVLQYFHFMQLILLVAI